MVRHTPKPSGPARSRKKTSTTFLGDQAKPDIDTAFERAETLLRLNPAPRRGAKDPKWQAVLKLGPAIQQEPQRVWSFIRRWGRSDDSDTRMAIATCLLEHLLEHHFASYINRVDRMARSDPNFADTASMCWKFGQSEQPENSAKFDAVIRRATVRARAARGKPSARAMEAALKKMDAALKKMTRHSNR